jgi:transcriptional regulator with XRE-family HTH domain
MVLGNRIHDRREQLGLTQEQLGDLIGKDQKQVWRYETGKQIPSAETLVMLARALETSTDYLVGFSDTVKPISSLDELDVVELEILALLRAQNPDQREKLLNAIRALA